MHEERLHTKRRLSKKFIGLGVLVGLLFAIGGFAYYQYSNKLTTQNKVKTTTNPVVEGYRKQLPDLAKQAESKPSDPQVHKNYAVALYATGDLNKAKDQYAQAIKDNGNDAISYNNLGNVQRDLGDYNGAIASYTKSIQLNPKGINSYINLGNMYDFTLGKPDLAVTLYKNAITQNPDSLDLQIQLGISYEQQKDSASAQAVYQSILKGNPSNPAAKAGVQRTQGNTSPQTTPTTTSATSPVPTK